MGNIIIILILLVIVVLALGSIKKRIKYGSSCCGTHDAPPSKIKVRDKNKSHYPFVYIINVDGMVCSNCERRVENALNSKEGLWAKVNLEKKNVTVRAKEEVKKEEFSHIISDAGYTMMDISLQK
ncbi:heavy metal-associated domain-containing protein [Treponema sp.]|uniref:heavy-metal-associated domain-containing protein n=1 Tax=Treponema sp. TaxID=166 RepID=UPI00298E977A|nr:heavy metal-associated domain-containing protein [Treponema sp.]MCR5612782.1 heavy-metal-associated domain-containing protein [Treponema sp.]